MVAMLWGALAVLSAALVVPVLYLRWYTRWERAQTEGMAYFSRPLAERERLKARIRVYSRPIRPIVEAMAAANRPRLSMPAFEYKHVFGPTGVSSAAVFAAAQAYEPRPEDVFVATQMRCGTTWMQQIVFQIVTRGTGDLSDEGFGHLYSMSPWIDATTTVSMADAPLVGERPTRIIKTHLPAALLPYAAAAKYVYVTRHPVSCFASIVDYNQSLLGPLAPPLDALADWYCSDKMYWLPWPKHVEGFWQWAATRPNVLFVHYEELIRDFPAALARIARFLGYDLLEAEAREITVKCSFKYMKQHEELFEMAPPSMFSVNGGAYLKSGKETRHEDITPELRTRILEYCRGALDGATYPVGTFYPDVRPGA